MLMKITKTMIKLSFQMKKKNSRIITRVEGEFKSIKRVFNPFSRILQKRIRTMINKTAVKKIKLMKMMDAHRRILRQW